MAVKINAHGGKRKGAGRKPAPNDQQRVVISIRLPRWLLDQMPVGSRTRSIEDALIATGKYRRPKRPS